MNIAIAKQNLKHYIDNHNAVVCMFRSGSHLGRRFNINNLTKDDISFIRADIENALVPENLSRDGEMTVEEQNQVKAYLMAVLRELPA